MEKMFVEVKVDRYIALKRYGQQVLQCIVTEGQLRSLKLEVDRLCEKFWTKEEMMENE